MKMIKIPSNVTRAFHKTVFQLKKHSPEILVVAGVVGTVTSAVMACKATLKVNEVVEQAKTDINDIHVAVETGKTKAGEDYNVEDSKKDLAIVYAQTGVKFIKLYGPAVALGTLSIMGMVKSNNILKQRNVALAAAYATVDKGFKEYRGRVIERFGEELDKELKYNLKVKEIEEKVVNEDGSETTVKKKVTVMDSVPDYSQYSIVFDDGNTGWDPNPEITKFFLLQQQSWANEKLQAQGYLFLNDVYKMLGARETKAGQVVGWVYDEDHGIDNFIDFGLYDIHRQKARDFVNGYEKVVILDFNVDGDITYILDDKAGGLA